MASQPVLGQDSACRWAWAVATSQIGAKVLMALTGLILSLFVLGHMAGNLQFFLGAEAINHYAELLQSKPPLLWTVRIVLLASVVIHIVTGLWLKWGNWQARPERYQYEATVQASYASRSMVLTGLMLLAFIVYHLLHLTVGVTNPDDYHVFDAAGRHDVYRMTITGFSNPLISGVYIVAMLLLGLHLSHAVSSMFQTLGLSHPRWERAISLVGPIFAVIVAAGFISIPISVLAGWLGSPAGGNG